MKKRVHFRQIAVIILAASLIFASFGCGNEGSGYPQDTESESGSISHETEPPKTEPPETESGTSGSEPPILDWKDTILANSEAVSNCIGLYRVSCEAVENFSNSSILYFNGKLLFYNNIYGDNETVELHLLLLDIKDGSSSTAKFSVKGHIYPQVVGEKLYLCDSHTGKIVVLDNSLTTVQTYTLKSDYGNWYVSSDGTKVYSIVPTSGITSIGLSDQKRSVILSDALDISISTPQESSPLLSYIDPESQKQVYTVLDTSKGSLVPIDKVRFTAISICKNNLLSQDIYGSGLYCLRKDNQEYIFSINDAASTLLSPYSHILVTNGESQLSLYNINGELLANCRIDGYLNQGLAYSSECGGYFFSGDHYGKPGMYFMDTSVEGSDPSLDLIPVEKYYSTSQKYSELENLYKRAEELSALYHVTVHIADQCQTDFGSFTSYEVRDYTSISNALDVLESVLQKYPTGFFEQLRYSNYQDISIQLVGGLSATSQFSGDGIYGAFAQSYGYEHLIVLDVYTLRESVLYHEFSHLIDKRLAWDAYCREDALFSEATWMKYNPSSFAYRENYGIDYGQALPVEWQKYFFDAYSTINSTEDRARIMENAMSYIPGQWNPFDSNSGLKNKLEYYSRCIRDCFDTTGWPEKLLWEIPLSTE